jgi:formylglycine-generating enzyme required for sulfatase activity
MNTVGRSVFISILLSASGGCSAARPTEAAVPGAGSACPAAWVAPVGQSSPIGRTGPVSAATFRMGSDSGEPDERPVHEVRVASFEMDLTEVTVGQYSQCVRAGACVPAPLVVAYPGVQSMDQQVRDNRCNGDREDRRNHPENCVDWFMADAYCRWAGERLPTEEEWEYAACGGDCDRAVASRTGTNVIVGIPWPFTVPVATTSAGPFGLFDMAGNVWEWTASPYCAYDHPGCEDRRRVVRGGSWSMGDLMQVRLTDRSPADPTSRNTNLGFRCARSLPGR